MAGAGGGHAAVLSAGMGWEARRAAGLGVRPETAAEATGRPPGFHWGRFTVAIHWRLSNCCGAENDVALAERVAGWGLPYTGGFQITVEWRAARRSMGARQAGSSHTLETPKAVWFGGGVAWLHLFLAAAVELLLFFKAAV